MIFWACAAAYLVIALFAARRAFYAIRADSPVEPGMDTAAMGLLALIIGACWPLALPIAAVIWHPRKTPDELREQLAVRDRRIAELEREAGIRP